MINAVLLRALCGHLTFVGASGILYKLGYVVFEPLSSSIKIFSIDSISSFNRNPVSKNAFDTINTFGLQSFKIDFISNKVNFISIGIVIEPAKTEANKAAPHSGMDSDMIANLSPLFIPLWIKKFPRRLDNILKPPNVNSFQPKFVFIPNAISLSKISVRFSKNKSRLLFSILSTTIISSHLNVYYKTGVNPKIVKVLLLLRLFLFERPMVNSQGTQRLLISFHLGHTTFFSNN